MRVKNPNFCQYFDEKIYSSNFMLSCLAFLLDKL